MKIALLIFLAGCVLAGCAHYPVPGVDQHEPRQAAISAPAPAPVAPIPWITLAWTNQPGDPSWLTGLVASTDLSSWSDLVVLPYSAGCVQVTLSNRPPVEFYRAFNREGP